jgi:hypothetical protein
MKFLSEEWLEAVAALEFHPVLGLDGGVVLKTEGGPDGKTTHHFVFEAGRLSGCSQGNLKGSQVQLSAPYDLLHDLVQGIGDPATEFMRGRLKMSGDMALWLPLLARLQDVDAGVHSNFAEMTDF